MKRLNNLGSKIMMVFATLVFLTCANIIAQENDIPTFSQYPVEVSKASPRPVRLNTKNARMFRTRLRNANKGEVNFAGYYIVAYWGCGTSCLQGAIIDTRTGRVHFPEELFKGFGMGFIEPDASAEMYEVIEFHPDSRLMVLNGWGGKADGVRFLVWERNRFRLVKFIPAGSGKTGMDPDIDASHLKTLNEWLKSKQSWRLAQIEDYDPELMKMAKADLGDSFTPYYVSRDFNNDSYRDFAVILVGDGENKKYGAAVFNGPFQKEMGKTPAFFTERLQEGDGVFFKDKLMVGPYASDNIFFLIPDGNTYKVEIPDFGEEAVGR